MDLSPYVDSVRTGVVDAAALADEHTRQVAERLGTAVEATTRLALIRALSDAADAINADLAPASVTLRMSGSDPEFDVAVPNADPAAEPTLLLPERHTSEGDATEPEDEPVARISLRLPASVKAKVDQMADREQISTNAWLLRAIMDALGERRSGDAWPAPPTPPIPSVFGIHGPFGPHGVFGAHGPFAPGGLLGPPEPPRRKDRPRGRVQGWVR